jgi:hypothetical protein
MSALLSRETLFVCGTGLKVLIVAVTAAATTSVVACGSTANRRQHAVSLSATATITIGAHAKVTPGDVVPVAVTVSKGKRQARRCWSCDTPELLQPWYRETAILSRRPRRTRDGITLFVETYVAPAGWSSGEQKGAIRGCSSYCQVEIPRIEGTLTHDVVVVSRPEEITVSLAESNAPEGVFWDSTRSAVVVRTRSVLHALPYGRGERFALLRQDGRIAVYGEAILKLAESVTQKSEDDYHRHEVVWQPSRVPDPPSSAAIGVGYERGWAWDGLFEVYRAHWSNPGAEGKGRQDPDPGGRQDPDPG